MCLCFVMHYVVYFLVLQSSRRARELVPLLLLSYGCLVTVNVLWLFLSVPWVGLQFVIVVFPDYTHLLFAICMSLQYLSVEIISSDCVFKK